MDLHVVAAARRPFSAPCNPSRLAILVALAAMVSIAAVQAVDQSRGINQARPATLTLTGPVNDFARMLNPEQRARVDSALRQILDDSGDAVVVATIAALPPGVTVRDYALKVFNENGIGERSRNNGLLILIAQSGQLRIATGLGLEQVITDAFAEQTARQMVAYFARQDFAGGLLSGIETIGARLREIRH